MATGTLAEIRAGEEDSLAYRLFIHIAEVEGVSLDGDAWNGEALDGNGETPATRAWILETMAQCLMAVRDPLAHDALMTRIRTFEVERDDYLPRNEGSLLKDPAGIRDKKDRPHGAVHDTPSGVSDEATGETFGPAHHRDANPLRPQRRSRRHRPTPNPLHAKITA